MITTQELVVFLRNSSNEKFSFAQNLKIVYRPYICPFDDLLNNLPEGQTVFDFGCGGGMFLQLVAEYKKPKALGGIEISEALIETAKTLLRKYETNIDVKLSTYNGRLIPDLIANYDYIFMIDVLHHIPKDLQISHLESLFRLMKPGAKLILKDINGGSVLVLFNKLHDIIVVREVGSEMNPRKLKHALENIGFETSEINHKRLYVYPHFTLTCEKAI
jgi:2-polyprenyl-3-methyl-5-hydroxy-6-metoxy-1,4-benzoquinol methylase